MESIVIINSNIELIAILQEIFKEENFKVATYQTKDIKEGRVDIQSILDKHKPDAILYDIAIPYEENWRLFKTFLNKVIPDDMRLILTTTNKRVLDKMVGPTPTIEIVGKPFDIDEIIRAARGKSEATT